MTAINNRHERKLEPISLEEYEAGRAKPSGPQRLVDEESMRMFEEAIAREDGVDTRDTDTFTAHMEESYEEGETQFSSEDFFTKVAAREGSGDTATSVPTAHFGVTKAAADAVGEPFSETMSKEISQLIGTKYVVKLEQDFASKVEGWESLPVEVKEGALDAAYNMGPQVFKFKGFMSALGEGDAEEAARQLLDTASIDGKSSKALAKRRAELYNNMVGEGTIDRVEQMEDGTLAYWKGDSEVFSYRPKGGKHETSSVGSITL